MLSVTFKTIPCMNQRPDIDNLLVNVNCFMKYGIPIVGFTNVTFQLPLIISYIHNKNKYKITKLCTASSIECAGEFFSYKGKDNIQVSDDMIHKGLLKRLTQLSNK